MAERIAPLGELGGRYRLRSFLAAGGMGAVWAAEDAVLGRPVAVKLLGEWLAGDPVAAERLRREARAAARLVHPNVARVLDLGEEGGRPYLVMELLEGESLAARIGRSGPLSPAEATRIAAAIADALQTAHRAGVVHCDVKPGNVFLTAGGDVKVLDFGIAAAAWEAALTGGEPIGTAAYLAPERALGREATAAADVYALGVVLYEMLTGRPPFSGDSGLALASAHLHARPPPLRQAAPWVPPALAAACEQALAKHPAQRPSSAAAFADLLRAAPSTATPHRPPPSAAAASTSRLLPAAAARTPTGRLPPVAAASVAARRRPVDGRRGRPVGPGRAGGRWGRSVGPGRGGGHLRRRRALAMALLLLVALLAGLPSLGGALPGLGGPDPAGDGTGTTAPEQGPSSPSGGGHEGSAPLGLGEAGSAPPGRSAGAQDGHGSGGGDDGDRGGRSGGDASDRTRRERGSGGPGGGEGSGGPG